MTDNKNGTSECKLKPPVKLRLGEYPSFGKLRKVYYADSDEVALEATPELANIFVSLWNDQKV